VKLRYSDPRRKRRRQGRGLDEKFAWTLVQGADEHIERVGKTIRFQALVALGLGATIWGLSAWNDFGARIGGDTASPPAIRVEPTSGSNILAAYALLGALLFALQVSVRSLNSETDVMKQLNPAELGRRQMVGFLASTAGLASFGLAVLCLFWYGGFGERLDPFRVIGPIGASFVLAAISAETLIVAETPFEPQLRRALEKRRLCRAKEAYRRLPPLPEGVRTGRIVIRAIVLVLVVVAASSTAWVVVLRDAPLKLAIASAVLALFATLLVCGASVAATASIARRHALESLGIIMVTFLLLVGYSVESWIASNRAFGPGSSLTAQKTALASAALWFLPAILAPLLSLRGFDGKRPGVLVLLASRRLQRTITALENASSCEEGKSEPDPARTLRRRRVWTAVWLSPVPLVPQLLLRISDVGRLSDEDRRLRQVAAVLSWTFVGSYTLVASCAATVWMA
jgi:hypothetical protein